MTTASSARILVTGGAGFIGSNFVRQLMKEPPAQLIVLDKLTYAGNSENLNGLVNTSGFTFVEGDICDRALMLELVGQVDAIVNFAAETHVDRSLIDPSIFLHTNILGTHSLLDALLSYPNVRFVQVSTDEVYGEVPSGYSFESHALHPRNPYSASKAAAEMLVVSYAETHGIQAMISRGSNTYGPYQYPEKFIPLLITNAMNDQQLPVYGDGKQIRHWIHASDHASAIRTILEYGEPGEAYNVGSQDELTNLDVVQHVLECLDKPTSLIQHVTDRKGHDRRYAVASNKLNALGWEQEIRFSEGIRSTVDWYRHNESWWRRLRNAKFDAYYGANYGVRSEVADNPGNDKRRV